MKVKELIKCLQEFDSRAEVKFEDMMHNVHGIYNVVTGRIIHDCKDWVIITPFEYNMADNSSNRSNE